MDLGLLSRSLHSNSRRPHSISCPQGVLPFSFENIYMNN